MHAGKSLFIPAAVIIAAACFAALPAYADTNDARPTGGVAQESQQRTAPSVNNDTFKQLMAQCETEVPSGKANGDICVNAAAMLFSADIPDQFREMGDDQRIKIALRLLERGVDSSNLARARAYDWYSKFGFLGMSSYADPVRAGELMDMMVKSGYPGGVLRKIRSTTSIIAFTSNEAEKREGCATAKTMLNEGKLDAESTSIAKGVVGSGICVGYEPVGSR